MIVRDVATVTGSSSDCERPGHCWWRRSDYSHAGTGRWRQSRRHSQ